MNICECGCGQECKNRFSRGHNRRKEQNIVDEKIIEEIEPVIEEAEPMIKEEVEFEWKEIYDLTNVPQNGTINYEAGRKWLEKNFLRYMVRVNYDEKELPCEVVLSVADFEVNGEGTWLIGAGNSFSNALRKILINV